MQIIKTKFKNLLIVNKPTHKDSRGYLRELYKKKIINCDFKFSILSKSKKKVLRGLHFQHKKPQAKYITVIKGKLFDVAVDLRKSSTTFCQWIGVVLSAENKKQIWIPPGFAHGFYVISESAELLYKCTEYYDPSDDHYLLWNDKAVGIDWPLLDPSPFLSDKDKSARQLSEAAIFP